MLCSAADCSGGPQTFIQEVQQLLSEYYVEDADGDFRFNLSMEYVQWALLTPDTDPKLLLAVRNAEGSMVAFLAAIPITMHKGLESYRSAMIDFVCVHGDYRGQRLCPFLYQEAQLRLNRLLGIDTIICTSGDNLPHPIGTLPYWHRANPARLQKLVECGFWSMPTWRTFAQETELYQVPSCEVKLRAMTPDDVPQMRVAFNEHVRLNHQIGISFPSDELFAHTFLPQKGLVATYIVVSDSTDVEMVSFTFNHQSILRGAGGNLWQAQLYYSMIKMTPREEILAAAMEHLFREHDVDIINALPVMGFDWMNLEPSGFRLGTGALNWYRCNAPPGEVDMREVAWLTV
jgi:hypothetical protein